MRGFSNASWQESGSDFSPEAGGDPYLLAAL
jgi:hypothetical protein